MAADQVIVDVGAGELRGEALDGVSTFRGVRYAQAPVGALRFRPPLPVPPWDGVRDALEFAPICPQIPTGLETMQGRMDLPMDEDCLALNVWTPACDDGRRPVLVWFHGGAWLNGTGAAHWFDGSSFARRHDLVVVTVNYRLNVFGFLHVAELAPGEDESGHVGMLDQVAALTWVRDHVAAFGGDPGRVTIAGESAGAMSVGTLLAMPPAKGLFHGAIMQSGVGAQVSDPVRAAAVARDICTHAGVGADAAGLAALRELPAEQLLEAFLGLLMADPMTHSPEEIEFQLAPVAGLRSLPLPPLAAVAAGASADVPVLLGTDEHEMEVMRWNIETFYDLDEDVVADRIRRLFGDDGDAALEVYRSAAAETGGNPWTFVDTDRAFVQPADQFASSRAGAPAPTFRYLWRWPSTAMGGRLGAVHTVEIPFVFNTLHTRPAIDTVGEPTAEAEALALRVHAAVAAFVQRGDPSTPEGLGDWPAYDVARRPVMVIDAKSSVVDDPGRERRLLWERAMARGA